MAKKFHFTGGGVYQEDLEKIFGSNPNISYTTNSDPRQDILKIQQNLQTQLVQAQKNGNVKTAADLSKKLEEVENSLLEQEKYNLERESIDKLQSLKNLHFQDLNIQLNFGAELERIVKEYKNGDINKFKKELDVFNKNVEQVHSIDKTRKDNENKNLLLNLYNKKVSDYDVDYENKFARFSEMILNTIGRTVGKGLVVTQTHLLGSIGSIEEDNRLRHKAKNIYTTYNDQYRAQLEQLRGEKEKEIESQEEMNLKKYAGDDGTVDIFSLGMAVNNGAKIMVDEIDYELDRLNRIENGTDNELLPELTHNLSTWTRWTKGMHLLQGDIDATNTEIMKNSFAEKGMYDQAGMSTTGQGMAHSVNFITDTVAPTLLTGGGASAASLISGGGKAALNIAGKYSAKGVLDAVRNVGMKEALKRGTIYAGKGVGEVAVKSLGPGAINTGMEEMVRNNGMLIDSEEGIKFLNNLDEKKKYIKETKNELSKIDLVIDRVAKDTTLSEKDKNHKIGELKSRKIQLEQVVSEVEGRYNEDWSVARGLTYGYQETFKEMFTEKLGSPMDTWFVNPIYKKLGKTALGQAVSRGTRKIGVSTLGKAYQRGLNSFNHFASQPLNQLTLGKKVGVVTANLAKHGAAKMVVMNSMTSEMFEEIGVNFLPNFSANDGYYQQNLEALLDPKFYEDVMAQTFLLNTFMGGIGTVARTTTSPKHTYKMMFDKEYRDKYKKSEKYYEELVDFYERVNFSGHASAKDILKMSQRGVFDIQDWESSILEYEKTGNTEMAQVLAEKLLHNIYTTGVFNGSTTSAMQIINSIGTGNTGLPQTVVDAVESFKARVPLFESSQRKFSNYANFAELYFKDIDTQDKESILQRSRKTLSESFSQYKDVINNMKAFGNLAEDFNFVENPSEIFKTQEEFDNYIDTLQDLVDKNILGSDLISEYLQIISSQNILESAIKDNKDFILERTSKEYQKNLQNNYVWEQLKNITPDSSIEEIEDYIKNLPDNEEKKRMQNYLQAKQAELERQQIAKEEKKKQEEERKKQLEEQKRKAELEAKEKGNNPPPPPAPTAPLTPPKPATNIPEIGDGFSEEELAQYAGYTVPEPPKPPRTNRAKRGANFSPMATNQAPVSQRAIDIIQGLRKEFLEKLGMDMSFKDFLAHMQNRRGYIETEKLSWRYKEMYEAATGQKISSQNFSKTYNEIFSQDSSTLALEALDTITNEEIQLEQQQINKDKGPKQVEVNPQTGTVEEKNIHPIQQDEIVHRAHFKGIDYKIIYYEDGSFEIETSSEELNNPQKNKNVLNGEVVKPGATFKVRPISPQEYGDHQVLVIEQDEQNNPVETWISFEEWLIKNPTVQEGSQEFIDKIPMIAETSTGDFVFGLKEPNWFTERNVTASSDSSLAGEIEIAQATNRIMRQSIWDNHQNNKDSNITITRRDFGSTEKTLPDENGVSRTKPLSQATKAKPQLAIAVSGTEVMINGQKYSKEVVGLVNKSLTPGQIYHITPINNTEEKMAVALTTSKDNKNYMPDVARQNMEMALVSSIANSILFTINNSKDKEGNSTLTEQEQKNLDNIKEYLEERYGVSLENLAAIDNNNSKFGDFSNDLKDYFNNFTVILDSYADLVNILNEPDSETSKAKTGQVFIHMSSHENGQQTIYIVEKGKDIPKESNGKYSLPGLSIHKPQSFAVKALLERFDEKGGESSQVSKLKFDPSKKILGTNKPMHSIDRQGNIIEYTSENNGGKTYDDFVADNANTSMLFWEVPDGKGGSFTAIDAQPIVEFTLEGENKTPEEQVIENRKVNPTVPSITPPVDINNPVSGEKVTPIVQETSKEEGKKHISEVIKELKEKNPELFKGFKLYMPGARLNFSSIGMNQEQRKSLEKSVAELIPGLNLIQQEEIVATLVGALLAQHAQNAINKGSFKIDVEELNKSLQTIVENTLAKQLAKEESRIAWLKENGYDNSEILEAVEAKRNMLKTIVDNKNKFTAKGSNLRLQIEKLIKTELDTQEIKSEEINEDIVEEESLDNALESMDGPENSWSTNNLQRQAKASLSNRVRTFFGGIKAIDPTTNEVKTNFLELPEYQDPNEVYNYLLGQLVGLPSDWNTILKVLEARKNHHTLGPIYYKLKDAPVELQNEIMHKLNLYELHMHTVQYTDGKLRIINENYNNGKSVLLREWRMNFQVGDNSILDFKDGAYAYNAERTQELIREFKEWVEEVKKNKETYFDKKSEDYNKRIEKLDYFLGRLGIKVGKETIESLVSKNNIDALIGKGTIAGLFNELNNDFKASINSEGEVVKVYDSGDHFKRIKSYIDNLANYEVQFVGKRLSNGFKSGNKRVQEAILPTLGKQLISSLKDPNSDYIKTLLDTVYAKNSYLLELLSSNSEEAKEVRKLLEMDFHSLDALSTKFSIDTTKLNELSDKDKQIVKMALFAHSTKKALGFTKNGVAFRMGRMSSLTVSDKDNIPLYNTVLVDLKVDKKSGNSTVNVEFDEENNPTVTLNDNILEFMYNETFSAELDRILHSYENDTNITNYNDASKRFLILSSFNNLEYTNEEDKNINIHDHIIALKEAGWTTEQIKESIESRFKESVKENLNEYFQQESSKTRERLESTKDEKGNIPMINGYLQSKMPRNSSMTKEVNLEARLQIASLDMAVNTLLHNTNQTKVLSGDMAMYGVAIEKVLSKEIKDIFKNNPNLSTLERQSLINQHFKDNPQANEHYLRMVGENMLKRMALTIAPGNLLANSEKDTYIQIFVNDVQRASSNIPFYIKSLYGEVSQEAVEASREINEIYAQIDKLEETRSEGYQITLESLEKRLKKLKDEIAEAYPKVADFLDITGTDAQEYTTWQEHLDTIYRQGSLSEKQKELLDRAYEKLSNNQELEEDEFLIVMQPIKPVYAGPTGTANKDSENEVKGINRMVYVKSSSFPLLPQLTKNSKLDKVRQHMERLQKDKKLNVRMSYQSANKVGSIDTKLSMSDLYNMEYEDLMKEGTGKLGKSILRMNRKNFKIQQAVPYKTDKYLAKGTEDYITMSTQMWKILMSNGINSMARKVFDSNQFDSELIKKFNEIAEALGVEAIQVGEKIDGIQLNALKNYIETKLFQKKYDELEKEIGFDSNKALPNLVKIIREELDEREYPQSIKDIVELVENSSGDLDFALPLWLSEDSTRLDNLLQSIVTKRVMKHSMPGNGLISTSSEGFQKVGFDKLDKETKQGIIWLDPNRTGDLKATTLENGKLKESEVLIQPKFRTRVLNKKTGKYETKLIDLREKNEDGTWKYINEENGVLSLKPDMIDENILQKFSLRIPVSSHQSGAILKVAGFLPPESADMIVLPKEHTTLLGEDYDIDKRYIYNNNYIVDENGRISMLTSENKHIKIQELEDSYNGELDDRVKEKIRSKVEDMLTENMIANIYKSVYASTDEEVQSKINKVLSMENAKETSKYIKDKLSSRQVSDKHFSVLSDFYQEEQMNSGTAGKMGTALHSLAVVIQAQLERVGGAKVGNSLRIGDVISDGRVGITNALVEEGSKISPRQVSDIHAENQNSAVDNIKAQIMFWRNENKHTMDVLIQMTLRGFDMVGVNIDGESIQMHMPSLLLSQPILRRYSELKAQAESNTTRIRLKEEVIVNNLIEETLASIEDEDIRGRIKADLELLQIEKKLSIGDALLEYFNSDILTGTNLYNNIGEPNPSVNVQLSTLGVFLKMKKESQELSSIKGLANKNSLPKSSIEVSALIGEFSSALKNLSSKYEEHGRADNMGIDGGVSLEESPARIIMKTNSMGDTKNKIENFLEKEREDKESILSSGKILHLMEPSSPEGVVIKNALLMSRKFSDKLYSGILREIDTIYKDYLVSQGLKEYELTKSERVKLKEKLLASYRDYALANSNIGLFTGDVETERRRLFFNSEDNTALANYMHSLKNNPTTARLFEQIPFLKPFIMDGVTIDPNTPSILKYSQDTSGLDIDAQYNSFLRLIADNETVLPQWNGVEMTPRLLAQELAVYAMLASQENGAIGFRKVINNKYLKTLGFGQTLQIGKDSLGNTLDRKAFLDQFIRHNPRYIENHVPTYLIETEDKDLNNSIVNKDQNLYSKLASQETITLKGKNSVSYFKIENGKQTTIFRKSPSRSTEDTTVYVRVSKLGQFGFNEYNSSKDKTYEDSLEERLEYLDSKIEELSKLKNLSQDSQQKTNRKIDKYTVERNRVQYRLDEVRGLGESREEVINEPSVQEGDKSTTQNSPIEGLYRDKDSKKILNEIKERNPEFGDIIDRLLKLDLSDVNIEFVSQKEIDSNTDLKGMRVGSYLSSNNTIYLNIDTDISTENYDNVMLEEFIHAATVNDLYQWVDNINTNEPIVREDAPTYVRKLVKAYQLAKENNVQSLSQGSYYITNLLEFVAGVFVDPTFVDQLDKATDTEGKSLLSIFKEAIASFIRYVGGKFSESVKQDIFQLIEDRIARNKTEYTPPISKVKISEEPTVPKPRLSRRVKPGLTGDSRHDQIFINAVDSIELGVDLFDTKGDITGSNLSAFFAELEEKEPSENLSEEELEKRSKEYVDKFRANFGIRAFAITPREFRTEWESFFIEALLEVVNKSPEAYQIIDPNLTIDNLRYIFVEDFSMVTDKIPTVAVGRTLNLDGTLTQRVLINTNYTIELIRSIENLLENEDISSLDTNKVVSLLVEKDIIQERCK